MANFAIVNSDNIVQTIVAADTIDGPSYIFSGYKIVEVTEGLFCSEGCEYNEVTNTFTALAKLEQ